MQERKYKVLDDMGFCLATDMSLDIALLFMKAYFQEYYNEKELRLELIVREDNEECKEY